MRRLSNEIRKRRAQRNKALRQEYRKYYFYNRPTWDIEKQLTGHMEEEEGDKDSDHIQPPTELHIPERARLAEILCPQPDDLNSRDLHNIRIEAAELMTVLYNKKETAKRKRIRPMAQTDIPVKQESPEPDRFPLRMDKTQCPYYIGSRVISEEERTFRYSRPAVMNDHFDREHIKPIKVAERSKSIFCEHPKYRRMEKGGSWKVSIISGTTYYVFMVYFGLDRGASSFAAYCQ